MAEALDNKNDGAIPSVSSRSFDHLL